MSDWQSPVLITGADSDEHAPNPSKTDAANKDGSPLGFKPVGRIEYRKRKYKDKAPPEHQPDEPPKKEVL